MIDISREIKGTKFTPQQIEQASSMDLSQYFADRIEVFGITIDDATTVDRDDGIWLVELDNGNFQLQVSITDVSAIIPKNSPIDIEANRRVWTLYHTSPVTPMLPIHISANLGSLEEREKRLALTIFFEINKFGLVVSFAIKETIFTNLKVFDYAEVESIITNPSEREEVQLLLKMHALAKLLGRARGGKSGILLDNGYLDEDGVLIQDYINTHQLIAEFMILTNTTIASILSQHGIHALFRTQDVGIEDLNLAKKIMGHQLVPATYAAECKSHVGLSLPHYCHFTSPLRRFCDLVNHRIVKALINQKPLPYTREELIAISSYINQVQQVAKQQRERYLKQKRKQELNNRFKNINAEEIGKLSDRDLSLLIEYAVLREIPTSLIQEVAKRIDKIQLKDLYYLWFLGKVNHFFEEENLDAISVLLIRSQIDGTIVKYEYEYCPLQKIYSVFCYLDGLTSKYPGQDPKKIKAKQKASLAAIKAHVENQLTDKPQFVLQGNIDASVGSQLKTSITVELENITGENIILNNFQTVEITNLSDRDFSKLIEQGIKYEFNSGLLEEIQQRINRLSPKDFYNLWFKGKINYFFEYEQIDAVSVLLINSQLHGSVIEYQFEFCPFRQIHFAFCFIDGLTTKKAVGDSKKIKAKQKAALASIQGYLENNLTDRPDPLPNYNVEGDLQAEVTELTNLESRSNHLTPQGQKLNYISIINDYCQIENLDYPTYSFMDIDNGFSCEICLTKDNRVFQAQGMGKSKKEAKRNAAQILVAENPWVNFNVFDLKG